MSVVKLSVHRNTLRRRKQHETKRLLRKAVSNHLKMGSVDGYFIATFDSEGNIATDWKTTETPVLSNLLPHYLSEAIRRRLADLDREDD